MKWRDILTSATFFSPLRIWNVGLATMINGLKYVWMLVETNDARGHVLMLVGNLGWTNNLCVAMNVSEFISKLCKPWVSEFLENFGRGIVKESIKRFVSCSIELHMEMPGSTEGVNRFYHGRSGVKGSATTEQLRYFELKRD
ncbi:hypothetical protein L1049_023538 [Liquidambar formosana]|uniref:Uncharacterized protein n=1 Tax=Liquidambar formosana TaxID=63359 RepID=A0AAP0RTL9_LIQFO